MADRTSLGLVGLIFGGITAAVILMAATVVMSHLDGHGVMDTATSAVTVPMVAVN